MDDASSSLFFQFSHFDDHLFTVNKKDLFKALFTNIKKYSFSLTILRYRHFLSLKVTFLISQHTIGLTSI